MSQVFQRPPCYELFFAALAVVLSPGEYERIQFAYFISKYGHAKQLRDDGARYFDHPKAATWIYIDELGGCLWRDQVARRLEGARARWRP